MRVAPRLRRAGISVAIVNAGAPPVITDSADLLAEACRSISAETDFAAR